LLDSLAGRGLLAFTLENAGNGVLESQLNPHGRYSHTRSYVEGVLSKTKEKKLIIH